MTFVSPESDPMALIDFYAWRRRDMQEEEVGGCSYMAKKKRTAGRKKITPRLRARLRKAGIKKPKVYEALKAQGYSKTKAAKISNAKAKKSKKK